LQVAESMRYMNDPESAVHHRFANNMLHA